MLHRAMPPAMAAPASLPAAGSGQQDPSGRPGRDRRNWVHAIAVCWLWCMSTLIAWAGPQLVHLGHSAIRLEQEHEYFTRLFAAAIRLVYGLMCWAGDSRAGRAMSIAVEYATQGVYGAIQEFAEGNVGHERVWRQKGER